MASCCNQRHRVLPLTEATSPLCWTCWTRSGVLHRDKGRSYLASSSQAEALICTTSSGGNSPRPTRTRLLFQACEPIGKEALAPKRDYFTASVQADGDLVVGLALGGVGDHFGSLDLKIRQRIFCRLPAQLCLFGRGQLDHIWARSWHLQAPPQGCLARPTKPNTLHVSVF